MLDQHAIADYARQQEAERNGYPSPRMALMRSASEFKALAVRPSQQVAFMRAEVDELIKLLNMAGAVATLAERCEEIGRTSSWRYGESLDFDDEANPVAARVLSSIRTTATEVQRVQHHAFQQLMQSTLLVTLHLSQAASLALGDVIEGRTTSGAEDRDADRLESGHEAIGAWHERLAPPDSEPEFVDACHTGDPEAEPPCFADVATDPTRSEPERTELPYTEPDSFGPDVEVLAAPDDRAEARGDTEVASLPETAEDDMQVGGVDGADPEVELTPDHAPGAPAPSEQIESLAPSLAGPPPEDDRPSAVAAKPRPLDGWLRALAGYYSSLLEGADDVQPQPQASRASAIYETRVAISGTSGLTKMMVAYRALSGIQGVREVTLTHATPDTAELLVRHVSTLDLASAVAAALPGVSRMGIAQPGYVVVEMGEPLREA